MIQAALTTIEADKVTVANLRDYLKHICVEIKKLKEKKRNGLIVFAQVDKENLKDAKKNRKALLKTLKYFLNQTDFNKIVGEYDV